MRLLVTPVQDVSCLDVARAFAVRVAAVPGHGLVRGPEGTGADQLARGKRQVAPGVVLRIGLLDLSRDPGPVEHALGAQVHVPQLGLVARGHGLDLLGHVVAAQLDLALERGVQMPVHGDGNAQAREPGGHLLDDFVLPQDRALELGQVLRREAVTRQHVELPQVARDVRAQVAERDAVHAVPTGQVVHALDHAVARGEGRQVRVDVALHVLAGTREQTAVDTAAPTGHGLRGHGFHLADRGDRDGLLDPELAVLTAPDTHVLVLAQGHERHGLRVGHVHADAAVARRGAVQVRHGHGAERRRLEADHAPGDHASHAHAGCTTEQVQEPAVDLGRLVLEDQPGGDPTVGLLVVGVRDLEAQAAGRDRADVDPCDATPDRGPNHVEAVGADHLFQVAAPARDARDVDRVHDQGRGVLRDHVVHERTTEHVDVVTGHVDHAVDLLLGWPAIADHDAQVELTGQQADDLSAHQANTSENQRGFRHNAHSLPPPCPEDLRA